MSVPKFHEFLLPLLKQLKDDKELKKLIQD